MLRWRLLSAAVILGTLSGLFWLDYTANFGRPGLWLAPLLLTLTALATGEALSLLAAGNWRPSRFAVYTGTLLVAGGACMPVLWSVYPPTCPLGKLGWPLAGLAMGVTIAFSAEVRRYREGGTALLNTALAVFIMAYVGVSLAFLAALRMHRDNTTGMMALLSLVIVVKSADTGAYVVGRLFGRHKLAPHLSPGKTIEGAVGGFVVAGLASWLSFSLLLPWLFLPTEGAQSQADGIVLGQASFAARPAIATSWWGSLIYGLVLALAGLIGDLGESLLKRDMGCKDSSTWLPGLGGVLDILDSLLLAAPVAYLCWVGELVR